MHSFRSAYREMIVEHLWLGALLRFVWCRGRHAEVLKSVVDDSGYDLVVDVEGSTRYIQLKSVKSNGRARAFTVARTLASKRGACVVVIVVTEQLELDHFRFFEPTDAAMELLPPVRHTRANAQGLKAVRPNYRAVPLSLFERTNSIDELAMRLFPILASPE